MRSHEYTLTLTGCLVATLTGALVLAGTESEWGASPPGGGGVVAGESRGLAAAEPFGTAFAGRDDALLASPMLDDPSVRAEVARWVRFWETRARRWVPEYLERMTGFADSVDAVLARHGLPWSLRYLPVLESGYSPTAVSSASAVGLWQFMEPTARDFDLDVSRLVDERRDPFRSTEAAADFLVQLRRDFGSWFLALAAYNAGPERVRTILRRHAPGEPLSDRLYWAIRPHLPRETREFVPKLLGAIIVAGDPEAHGYRTPEPRPFAFDRILVADRTSLAAVARVAGVSRAEIERLNPQFVRGTTPPGTRTYVRVPPGTATRFRPGGGTTRRGDGEER